MGKEKKYRYLLTTTDGSVFKSEDLSDAWLDGDDNDIDIIIDMTLMRQYDKEQQSWEPIELL
jgi:hypothetical protein